MLLTLPAELLYEIISWLAPATSNSTFSPSSSYTKDLLTLTLVCKTTSSIANEFLIKNCFYLGSAEAAECLLGGLLTRFCREREEKNQLVLEPTQAVIFIKHPAFEKLTPSYSSWPLWPPEIFTQHANAFDTLFSRIGHCLKRLVLNSNFHTFAAENRGITHARVREGFRQLKAIEEFYCIEGDENAGCWGTDDRIPIWTHWPKLKRLALYGPNATSKRFLEALGGLSDLTHLCIISIGLPAAILAPHIALCYPHPIEKAIVARLSVLDNGPSIEIVKFSQTGTSAHSLKRSIALGFSPVLMETGRPSSSELWFFDLIQKGVLWELEPTTDTTNING